MFDFITSINFQDISKLFLHPIISKVITGVIGSLCAAFILFLVARTRLGTSWALTIFRQKKREKLVRKYAAKRAAAVTVSDDERSRCGNREAVRSGRGWSGDQRGATEQFTDQNDRKGGGKCAPPRRVSSDGRCRSGRC